MMKNSLQHIAAKVNIIRGMAVLLDSDLALWYEVETRVLNQAVKRNIDRFPDDFMFQLSKDETQNLISQNVISSAQHGGRRKLPFVFTEQGVSMLSSVLRSQKAIAVHIAIMRAFVAMRQHALNYEALATALKTLEGKTDHRFAEVSKVLDALLEQKQQQDDFEHRQRIGFKSMLLNT